MNWDATVMGRTILIARSLGLVVVFGDLAMAQPKDPLLSWNHGEAKQSILNSMERVTLPRGA